MIYLIGFGLVFVGFVFGFILAGVLAASGRASRMEEEPFRPELLTVDRLRKWPDSDNEWKSARDAYQGKADGEGENFR
jgi:hypothetical protein